MFPVVEQSSVAKPTRGSPSNVMKRSPPSAKGAEYIEFLDAFTAFSDFLETRHPSVSYLVN